MELSGLRSNRHSVSMSIERETAREAAMEQWVDIQFDCIPLRSVTRLDVPLDASPRYQALCQRIKSAIERHGVHNAYYLHNAHCLYHLTNDPHDSVLEFAFEGTVFTDDEDVRCKSCDLEVRLQRETCDWLTQPVVQWFSETVRRAVAREFDRYIQAGDLQRAKERIERIQKESDEAGGFIGMYL
jgi:hypothetical protein